MEVAQEHFRKLVMSVEKVISANQLQHLPRITVAKHILLRTK
jgi:hypothetical protein